MTCPACPVCKEAILIGHRTHTQLVNGQLLSVHIGCEAVGDNTDPMAVGLNASGESPEPHMPQKCKVCGHTWVCHKQPPEVHDLCLRCSEQEEVVATVQAWPAG